MVVTALVVGVLVGAAIAPVSAQVDGPSYECRPGDLGITSVPSGPLEENILAGEDGAVAGSFEQFMPKVAAVLGAGSDAYVDLTAACDTWVLTIEPLL
jgi:hypothetical protein